MSAIKIMIVDDEQTILESMRDYFEGYDLTTCSDAGAALDLLKQQHFDIIVSDYKMPHVSGLELLLEAKKGNAYDFGILLTAYADKELVEEFLNQSLVCRVVEKPLRLETLQQVINDIAARAREKQARESEIAILKTRYEELRREAYGAEQIIGMEGGLQEVFKTLQSGMEHPVNVLLTGETGTGKEVLARAIHFLSPRRDGPFIKINCSAIPENLLESELFGYRKGAFTDAKADKMGKIELADGGTLFLDEIGDMQLRLQAKLLRVLQEKEVERLGGTAPHKVDFRLIAATNRDLLQAIQEKEFREDLYYRINTFPLHLPPLRERLQDLEELTRYFAARTARELGIAVPELDKGVVPLLRSYQWPGNIRELENAVTRAIMISPDKSRLLPAAFSFLFAQRSGVRNNFQEALLTVRDELIRSKIPLKDLENAILSTVLEHFDGNVMEAVRNTGISKDRFYRSR